MAFLANNTTSITLLQTSITGSWYIASCPGLGQMDTGAFQLCGILLSIPIPTFHPSLSPQPFIPSLSSQPFIPVLHPSLSSQSFIPASHPFSSQPFIPSLSSPAFQLGMHRISGWPDNPAFFISSIRPDTGYCNRISGYRKSRISGHIGSKGKTLNKAYNILQ